MQRPHLRLRRDDLWDELVLDSGSVSTACPYAWCLDISVNDGEKVYLQDIQQRKIPPHGSRVVPLELWGLEGSAERKVKFDVADVAYPVVSLGKMIESGFTFSFDDYKCYMHKDNKRVEIFRKGSLVPFGEVVMAKIADADKMRASKLDSAWVKAVWVGCVDKSNEHLLLTRKGCIRSRVVRRIPDGNQASYHAEVQGLPWDTLKGSAEMSRTTTTSRQEATGDDPMPSSSDDHLRQPTAETDVIEQNIAIDAGTARVSDDRANQGVLRMNQAEGISAEEQARRRLRSKQPARRSLTDDEVVTKKLKREATTAAIKQEILKTDTERPEMEQEHKFYASIRTLRSLESIHASRMVEINKWRERGVVERWSRRQAMTAGVEMFNARWVDEQHKEQSRYVVKEFANTRDPTMFAAASDTAVGRVVEFKAVHQNYSMFTFDVTSACTHAREDELVFLEPPPEEIEEHGDCVWKSIRVIWVQDRGKSTLTPFSEARKHDSEVSVEAHPKCPTLYFVREADGVIELHVDDGHGCGKETIVAELLAFLSEKIEVTHVQGIWSGSYEYLKTMRVRDEKKFTSIPNKKYLQSALSKLEMGDCKGSVSPKLDKACIDGDSEELDEEQTSRFRSSVLTLLSLSNRREQLNKRLEAYTDSDWASEQTKPKSTSGAVIMAEGMRLHARSRGQASEAEVMAAPEGIKEALLLQEVLMFAVLGHDEIEVKVDSGAAHALFENLVASRLDCCGRCEIEEDTEDMLTHTTSAKELEVCRPLMGLRCCSERDKAGGHETSQAGTDQDGAETVYCVG